ncbi:hypothetical protein JAAARDRAFT_293291 [Jaapia argillacea MUCL 33604]|uniref:ASTRA-associated protein 1 n=1 Tax=Jaapia argillacea MUCL 33604 TaxID=933084 RepID=A0A067Q446_9AGAM|nr:hypothetical protein JAAARDRAFT_293291 [Jaapia argillacea MUCL 33604]
MSFVVGLVLQTSSRLWSSLVFTLGTAPSSSTELKIVCKMPPPAFSQAPSPSHLLRTHTAHVNTLWFSDDNERLYSGDAAGLVVITSTRTFRPLAAWNAHTDGLLGVQELWDCIITHGRDNKLHVWERLQEPTTSLGGSAAVPGLTVPSLRYSMDVNALNYCRFSLHVKCHTEPHERSALLALPNLVEFSLADIWVLPSRQRLHAAIGKPDLSTSSATAGRNASGIIMSMHLFEACHPSTSDRKELRILLAYEDGSVNLRRFAGTEKETSIEGVGWESLWSLKFHAESVMAMAVAPDNSFALSVSADHLVGRYDLIASDGTGDPADASTTLHRTKYPGNGAIAIRDDGRVCAIGGWDGKIRLYSTKSFKALGTLNHHKSACQALAFARSKPREVPVADEDSEDEMSEEEKNERSRWLASGGRDTRVAVWVLMNFSRS